MSFRSMAGIGILTLAVLAIAPPAWGQGWDIAREIAEGNREIRREKREALREILSADSGWEVAHEIREGAREIRREKREKRREVRREILEDIFHRR